MDYQTVIDAYFDPSTANHQVAASLETAPARRLRDAFEPLSMHAVWSPLVHERMSARGLDFFGTYALGRACVLGEPSGAVVASAFAAFEPGMIGGVYEQARSTVPRDEAYQITFDSTAESLRSVLDGVDEQAVASVASRLAEVVDGLDPTGRPLFSGVQALDWPTDPYGQLWQATLALREHRGDAHVVAYTGENIDPVRMNILTELWLGYPMGEYSDSRAWPEEATAAAVASLQAEGLLDDAHQLTASGIEMRELIEARTDAMEQGVVDALGADLDPIAAQLAGWSQRCVDGGTFPPDPRKRAAG